MYISISEIIDPFLILFHALILKWHSLSVDER